MDKRKYDLVAKFHEINQGNVDKRCLEIFYRVVDNLFDGGNVITVPYASFKIEKGVFVEVEPTIEIVDGGVKASTSDDINTVKTFSFKWDNPELDIASGVIIDSLSKIFSECSVVLLYSINIIIEVDEEGNEKLICKYRMV